MSSDDAALDAAVDRILLGGARPSSSSTAPVRSIDDNERAPSASGKAVVEDVNAVEHASVRRPSQTSSPAPLSVQPPPTATLEATTEEEDLNVLVERILAGPGPAAHTSNGTTRHLRSSQSPTSASLSISPAGSSPRFQLPQSYTETHQQRHIQQQQQQQQSPHQPSASGSSEAARHRTGGSTRADRSLSRASGGGLLNSASSSPMNAVVRRLARWQERREAKRVQSVYEALEREHEECTFEPSINRLGGGGTGDDRSRSHSGGDHGKDVEDVSRKQQQQQRASSGGRAESPSHYAPLCRRDSHRRSTSTASYETDGAEYVPSLLPPTQPVYGAAAFIERLRGAREERDAVTAAAEAKRLHYYDSTSFTRGVTVPVPFELGDSRPRRVASSTAAVPGVPSPLARLRAAAGVGMSFTETGDGGSRGTPLQASSPSRVGLTPPAGVAKRGGNNCSSNSATLTRSLFSHMLGRGPRVEEEDEDGWTTPSASAAAAAVQYEYAGEEEEGEERLTAENTFLSLAPQIRETLLFDQGMAQQLHRATESIRRGVV